METRTCGKCSLYSYSLQRCKEGKANPRTLKGTVDAMRWFGPSYICRFSKWKTKAINRLLEKANVVQQPAETMAAGSARTCVCGARD